jgi:predicted ArsR family transcriptional regulator
MNDGSGSLADRVLGHLHDGPDHAGQIAAALGADPGAVRSCLTYLRKRGAVHVADVEHTERGRERRVYAASDGPVTRPLPSPLGDALGSELARLRAHADTDADPEIVALLYGNTALPGA